MFFKDYMSKLWYILSIVCLFSHSFAVDLGCTNPDACNFNESAVEDDGSCEDLPGVIGGNDLLVIVNAGENNAEVSWDQPCGLGDFFVYRLIGEIDGEEVDESISSPYVIDGLSWSTEYSLYIKTETQYGISNSPFSVIIGPENVPSQIQGVFSQPDEASILLSWDNDPYASTYNVYIDGEIVVTSLADSLSVIVSNLNANIDYAFQVSGVNSEFIEGDLSEVIYAQVLPIPSVSNISSLSGSGQVSFFWGDPIPYANDSIYSYKIISGNNGDIIENNYIGNSYTIDNLNENDQRCISVIAIHNFGESDNSEQICESSNIPPPAPVEGLVLSSGEGYVELEWDNYPGVFYYNVYRDGQLLTENPLYFGGPGEYLDSLGVLGGVEYSYVVTAIVLSNGSLVEGVSHNPISVIVNPLPVIENIEIIRGSSRLEALWEMPPDYAGFGYSFEIYDEFDQLIKSTQNNYTFIPNLNQDNVCCNNNPIDSECICNEYCFKVKSVSLGGYGNSEFSEVSCGIPKTSYGESLEWGIQIVAQLVDFNGNSFSFVEDDEFNLVGVASEASDGFDSEFDLIEYPGGGDDRISLFFPHPEWGHSIGGQLIEKFTQDVRSDIDLSSSVINWDMQLESPVGGFPKLKFFFNNDVSGNTVYLFYRGSNNVDTFQKIENGEIINLAYLGSNTRASISLIVGNAIPEPPINLNGYSGYREVTINWEDPCCQSGFQQYPAERFNIFRNGELKGENIIGNQFVDRGLDFSSLYTYEVSAVNIAGEGEKSVEVLELSTLENRSPTSKAGIDIVVYDLYDDDQENVAIVLPVNSDFTTINKSFDPDNSFEEDGALYLYPEPLDSLEFSWTSVSSENYVDSILSINIEGYGKKGFQLEVSDGTDLSSIDSVFVDFMPMPAPAVVDSINISAELYSAELNWLESRFTGESYADLNNNSIWDDKESFNDCGFDNLCPGDLNYTYPDEGEGTGTWEFEDLNSNGWLDFDDIDGDGLWDDGEGERFELWFDEDSDGFWNDYEPFIDSPNEDGLYNNYYDPGPRPRPPYYGMPSNIGPDNIATKYMIRRNNSLILEFMSNDSLYLDTSQDGDLFSGYTFFDNNLIPATEYCYEILACNYDGLCSNSEVICIITKDRPVVNVVYPNGAEIIGDGALDIELAFENVESIKSLDIILSYDGQFNSDAQTVNILTTDVINTFYENINTPDFEGYSNQVRIKAIITDVGDYSVDEFLNYSDISDYEFIVSENKADYDFAAGFHLFGSPIGLDENDFYSIISNSGIGANWTAFNQEYETENLILNSGEGYYIWLYESGSMELSGELYNDYEILLDGGWNLISNPLIEPINIGAFDIIRANGDLFSMSEAISEGLISSRLVGFDNSVLTHTPSFIIEPFKGYWIFAHESSLILKIENKLNPDLISEPSDDNDWRLRLSAKAYNNGAEGSEFFEVFGDVIDLGFSENALDEFRAGEDEFHLPFTSQFPNFTYLQIDNSNWLSQNADLYSPYFSKDIQKSNDTLYVWNIIGNSENLSNPGNPNEEIVLSWEMDDLDEQYSIMLYFGENPTPVNMRTQNNNQITILEENFENMRIEIKMLEFTSGCNDETACNYYCFSNIDCEGGQPPSPFFLDGSCEYDSCVGCSDPFASNYNPNAAIDVSSCQYEQSFLLSYERNIYPEPEIENRIPIYLHNYDSEYISGVELQLLIDPDKVIVSDVDISSGVFSSNLSSYDMYWGYTDEELRDTLGIIIYSTSSTPINPYGINKMFDLVLEVTGEVGEQLTIDFVQSDLNIRSINSNFQKLNILKGLFQVEGSVEYYSNIDAPVDGVKIDLVGISELTGLDTAYSQHSGLNGEIVFPEVLRGSYLSVSSKEDITLSGLSAVDASRIARESVGLIDLTERQRYVADVDLNGLVNAFDASSIARLLVGNVDSLNYKSLSWRFLPKNENEITLFDQSFISRIFEDRPDLMDSFAYPIDWIYQPSLIDVDILLSASEIIDSLDVLDAGSEFNINDFFGAEALFPMVRDSINQSIVGYKIGDVDGDWYSDIPNLNKDLEFESYQLTMSENEELLVVPLAIDGHHLIEGVDINIEFSSEFFTLERFDMLSETLTQADYQIVMAENEMGASIVIYCTSNLKTHDGFLGNLIFRVSDGVEGRGSIALNNFKVNGDSNINAGFKILDGSSYIIVNSIDLTSFKLPESYSLSKNYPNPFNPSTLIPFALPYESNVRLSIYDVKGRLVEELVNYDLGPGYHEIFWDAGSLASGLYFIKLESISLENSDRFMEVQKSLLVK